MRRFLLTAVIAVGFIIGFHVSIEPGATPALAVTPSPVPSCQFAGYDPSGSVINTTIVCATPGGGGVNSVNGGSCISVNPNTGDTIVDYTCATPVPLTVSTPLVLSTPGGNTINIACPGCGGGGIAPVAAAPTANPSAVPGYLQVTGGIAIGQQPDTLGAYVPSAIQVGLGDGLCSGNTAWGTSGTLTIMGVHGYLFSVTCRGNQIFGIDQNGNVGANGVIVGGSLKAVQNDSDNCPDGVAGSVVYACTGSNSYGSLVLGTAGTAGTNYCLTDWNRSTSGYYTIGCALNLSNSTKNVGEVTCTVASGTSCTQTATVRSGARCTATMETADSTLAGPYYAPSVDTSSTTLTVTMTAFTLGSGNLAADYWCP